MPHDNEWNIKDMGESVDIYPPGPNLVILAWTGDELWCRQAQNEVHLDF